MPIVAGLKSPRSYRYSYVFEGAVIPVLTIPAVRIQDDILQISFLSVEDSNGTQFE